MGTNKHTTIPDFLVLTTCELALRQAPKRLEALLAQRKTKLICVVHHADHWAEEQRTIDVRPWVNAEMIEFWTLSPHTATFLHSTIAAWNSDNNMPWDSPPIPPIRVFVPVFPVEIPFTNGTDPYELRFAMQGD